MEVRLGQFKDGRSIMLDEDGKPQTVELLLRPSKASPTRIKAALVFHPDGDEDPDTMVPLPFAQVRMKSWNGHASGFEPEFRLEMN